MTLQLKAAELALPEEPDVAPEPIMRVQELARRPLREARERVWDMRETDLGGDDLPGALETIAGDRTSGSAIEISVIPTGERRCLTRSVADAGFRIGREAVMNAVRHADAHRIDIRVEFGADRLRLEVQEDRRGFTPPGCRGGAPNGHFGFERRAGAGHAPGRRMRRAPATKGWHRHRRRATAIAGKSPSRSPLATNVGAMISLSLADQMSSPSANRPIARACAAIASGETYDAGGLAIRPNDAAPAERLDAVSV